MQGWSRHATGRYVGGEVGSGSCCSLWSGRIEREARHGAAGSAHAIALQDGESARKGFFGSRIIAAACRHGIFDTAAKQHSTEMIMCSLLSGRSFDSSEWLHCRRTASEPTILWSLLSPDTRSDAQAPHGTTQNTTNIPRCNNHG